MSRREFLGMMATATGVLGTGCSSIQSKGSDGDRITATNAADYYVATDGNDSNPGTGREPLATLGAAAEDANPGETIHVRGGVYQRTESITLSNVAGTAEERITLAGSPGERPVFEFDGPTPGGWGASGPNGGGIKLENVRHLTVDNIAVRNSPYIGIVVTSGSRHNEFKNVVTSNNNLVGFMVTGGSNRNVLRNVVSVNNYDPQNGGGDADGIQISNAHDNRITGAKLYYNSDDGLDLWESRSNVVEHCFSMHNGRGENGDGNGFKLGGGDEEQSGGHVVRRNVAFNNENSGFDYNEATLEMDVYNNTGWNNPTNFEFYDAEHTLENNISAQGEVSIGSDVDDTHNTWNLNIQRPGFVSLSPGDELFLHLQEDSPCIDRGTEKDLDYAGDAPDLGAYEYRPDERS